MAQGMGYMTGGEGTATTSTDKCSYTHHCVPRSTIDSHPRLHVWHRCRLFRSPAADDPEIRRESHVGTWHSGDSCRQHPVKRRGLVKSMKFNTGNPFREKGELCYLYRFERQDEVQNEYNHLPLHNKYNKIDLQELSVLSKTLKNKWYILIKYIVFLYSK